MSRSSYVAEEKRDNIIRLRKSGASWVSIETMTDVPRRTAKHVFEEWQQSRAEDEIALARRQVAAEAFNRHMQDLVALAEHIVENLTVPDPKDRRSGAKVLESTLESEIRSRPRNSWEEISIKKDTARTRRQNQILFSSLKEHTKGQVDWDVLQQWIAARDRWSAGIVKAEKSAEELVGNILSISNDSTGIDQKIRSDRNMVDTVVRGMAGVVHGAVVDRTVNQAGERIQLRDGPDKILVAYAGKRGSFVEVTTDRKELAERVVAVSRQAMVNLTRGKESKVTEELSGAMAEMLELKRQLEDKLDELRLVPLILRTRCEICP